VKKIRIQKLRKTKILIPFLLLGLTILLCVGAASAANIYVNGTGGKDTNSGSSWQYAKQTIGNATGTVTSGGTVYIAKGTYKGTKNTGIIINKNMTLIGHGKTSTIIDAEKNMWIFRITSGITVTLKNITIKNGSGLNGGAITNYGKVNIVDSSLTNNTADDYGGAILNYGILHVTASTFTNNIADGGGAIYNYGNLNTANSTFTNNIIKDEPSSSYAGGAITNTGTLNITDCKFTHNKGPVYGGAIFNTGSLKIKGSNFTGNTANDDGNGGAIYNDGTCGVANSNFISNMAAFGGAIANSNILIVDNCTFKDNNGISAGAILNLETGTCTVKNSTFTGNGVDDVGGVMENIGNLTIIDSTFTNNTATTDGGRGGAIMNMESLNIIGSTFTGTRHIVQVVLSTIIVLVP
jgi:hypothetical protein